MRKQVSARRQKKNGSQYELVNESNLLQEELTKQLESQQIKYQLIINDLKESLNNEIEKYQNRVSELECTYEKNLILAKNIKQELEVELVNYKDRISILDDQLSDVRSRYKDLEVKLDNAQLVRSNHWRKYEVEQLKNKLLTDKVNEQDKVIQKFEKSLSWSLGNLLIKFFNKKISLESMVSLVLNEYVIFKNKNGQESLISIDQLVRQLVESKITRVANHNSLSYKIFEKYSKTIIDRIIFKINNEIVLSKGLLDSKPNDKLVDAKYFLDTVEKSAIEEYEEKNRLKAINNVNQEKKAIKVRNILKEPKDLNVAVVFDEFTYECFKYEFNAHVLEPLNWRKVFEDNDIDIFFCESAWSGVDSNSRPWKGQIYASRNFVKENRSTLLEILKYCKENSIPTVFWNKEDPTHYPDEIHCFTKTAVLFDHIFTVSEECIDKYKKDFNFDNVHLLPFATQPKIFNPIEENKRITDITFAGSWYANHIERSKDMENIFDNILKSNRKLKIYDRFYGSEDPNHIFPEKYQSYTLPPVKFSEIDKVYKESSISLTMNTVKDSKTMIARRAFELMSCNTLVLSNHAIGMDNLFPNMFLDLESDGQAITRYTDEALDRIREKALKHVLTHHTYTVRWEKILKDISFPYIHKNEKITCCFYVNNLIEINEIISIYDVNTQLPIKILFILTDEFDISDRINAYINFNNKIINCIAESYLKNYGGDINRIIDTPFVAIVDQKLVNWENSINESVVHLDYIKDRIMLLDQGKKYQLLKIAKIQNVIFEKRVFNEQILNIGKTIENNFYSFNIFNDGV